MAEFTDLQCSSPATAKAVKEYLDLQIADDAELGRIDSVVEKSTVRITYLDLDRNAPERRAVDMQVMGYRDGYNAGTETMRAKCVEKVREQVRHENGEATYKERAGQYDIADRLKSNALALGSMATALSRVEVKESE